MTILHVMHIFYHWESLQAVFPELATKIWVLNELTATWLLLLSDLPVNRAGKVCRERDRDGGRIRDAHRDIDVNIYDVDLHRYMHTIQLYLFLAIETDFRQIPPTPVQLEILAASFFIFTLSFLD